MSLRQLAHWEPGSSMPMRAKFDNGSFSWLYHRQARYLARAKQGKIVNASSSLRRKMFRCTSPRERKLESATAQQVLQSFAALSRAATSSGFDAELTEATTVSVIVPIHNELHSIEVLVERIGSVMQKRGGPYEIICVDDGSTDGSTQLLKAMATKRRDLRAVIFRRNFGQSAAMTAGLDLAVGEILVTLDGDLQNDADDIPTLLEHLLHGNMEEGSAASTGTGIRHGGGYDLVCGWRRHRNDHPLTRNAPSKIANWLIGAITGVRLHDHGCSLRAWRASLVTSLRLYGEMHRFIPALVAIEGASISELQIRHHARTSGKSKYGLGRVPRVLLDLVILFYWTKFRDRPMQLVGIIGILCFAGSSLAALHGWFSILSAARSLGWRRAFSTVIPSCFLALDLLLKGVQFLFLGLLLEVCMRTYFESQQLPAYRVREVATFEKK